MKNKIKKLSVCTLLALSLGCTGIYAYQNSVNTEISQQKVVGRFLNTFYDSEDKGEFTENIQSLFSSDYLLELSDGGFLEYDSEQIAETDGDEYLGYTISKTSKEKVNDKKVTVYSVNVDFIDEKDDIYPKRLYIELVKEDSEWKINKLMPRSV